ncbi:MAG: hypothetical protein K8H89_00915 [Flavobacteriales bacterium]|jgi:hypothetical protein|nr:hypothetical protein [Flavobacteriales bacterium]
MKTIGTTPLVHALALVTMVLSACNGQAQQHQTGPAKADTLAPPPDTPRTEVRVNKEYDANGNLIAYDSTYSSYYNSHNADPAYMDSLFRDFRPRFRERFPFLTDPGFNDLFFRDSLLYPDFFHNDFFRKRMEMNTRWMEEMMARMDSLKNEYFRDGAVKPPRQEGKPQ